VDAHQEAELLLLVRDREPIFDQFDAGAHECALEAWDVIEEILDLLIVGETHDALYPGAVVPGAVEQHDLSGARQMRYIALEVPLRLFPISRRGQGNDATDARVQPLHDPFDGATLAGGISAFEDDDQLIAGVHHPFLQFDQLRLQSEQFVEIDFPFQRRFVMKVRDHFDFAIEAVVIQL